VSLGAAYNLTAPDSSGKSAGAVNVRAGAYNGNIFNVLSTANTGAATMNLANLESGQTDGQLLKIRTTGLYAGSAGAGVLNLDATSATGGTIARIAAGTSFTGNILDLQANGASRFKVDATNTTVAGSLLGSNASGFSIDATVAQPINVGGTTATTLNLGRLGQTQALLGNATVAGTLGVTGNVTVGASTFTVAAATGNTVAAGTLTSGSTLTVTGTTPTSALVVSNVGNLTAQGSGAFGPSAGNQLIVQGAATGSGTQVRATGATDPDVAISLAPKGTGRVKVAGATGGLDVDNDIVAGTALANRLQLAGAATTLPVSVNATGLDPNITLQLTPKGTGTVQVNGAGGISGPTAAALLIDATGAQSIAIGGTNATTLSLGRSGQLQALLGNVTVAGTLGVTGNLTVNTNKLTVTAATGALAFAGDLNINGGKFTVAAATGNTVIGGSLVGNNATGFLIDASGTQPISIGTTTGTAGVTIGRAGQLTTVAGNAQVNGTFTLSTTGSALAEMRTGTCTVANTAITGLTTVKTGCTIVGGSQNLSGFTVSIVPLTTPPTGLLWGVDTASTTQIIIRWGRASGGTINSSALTFRWFAVR